MALFSFYNMRKPRQFDHKPIYWDPHNGSLGGTYKQGQT